MRETSFGLGLLFLVTACAPASTGTGRPGWDDPPIGARDAGPRPGPGPGPGPTPACPGGGVTTLAGRVMFPNGTLPVAAAQVLIPAGAADAIPASGSCGECIDSGLLLAHTETAADGTFELTGVPEGARELVIRKGKFQRVVPVDIVACTRNEVSDEEARLPRDASEGRIPRIAVISGQYDHMEDVLGRLGLARSAVTVLDGGAEAGGGTEARAFMRDAGRLGDFDIVFVNCGNELTDYVAVEGGIRDAVRTFLEGGGRLFVTDWAYDLIESIGPAYVDFNGSGSGSTVEAVDIAQVGEDIPMVTGRVHDEGLREWLGVTGSLLGADTVDIRGMAGGGGWAVMDRTSERTKVWVDANVSWWDEWGGPGGSGVRPLTVTFEAGCGRALYTSYHTLDESVGTAELAAQEKILAYLVLEIGTCIEETIPPLF